MKTPTKPARTIEEILAAGLVLDAETKARYEAAHPPTHLLTDEEIAAIMNEG